MGLFFKPQITILVEKDVINVETIQKPKMNLYSNQIKFMVDYMIIRI